LPTLPLPSLARIVHLPSLSFFFSKPTGFNPNFLSSAFSSFFQSKPTNPSNDTHFSCI